MGNKTGRIQSDLLIHPGEELADVLTSLGMTQKALAFKSGISRKHINRIVQGKERISPKVAVLLESVLGTPASFWINLMRNYELDMVKMESESVLEQNVHELECFPVKDMLTLGWLKRTDSKTDLVKQLLSFLGVASFEIFRKDWQLRFAAAYRKSATKDASKEALAVWVRAGQIQAQKKKLPKYQESALKSLLPKLREKTQDLGDFVKSFQPMLEECGVPVVLVPHLKGTYANGATYWIEDSSRPVLQLSLRHKWCDIIIFSLFHEIGHILKHPRTKMFIEDDVVDKLEDEANIFAGETIIPGKEYRAFLSQHPSPTPADVEAFAKGIKINPCMVVGRLQRKDAMGKQVVKYTDPRFRTYKPKFEWGTPV
jgi:addiction module HigA family antidote